MADPNIIRERAHLSSRKDFQKEIVIYSLFRDSE